MGVIALFAAGYLQFGFAAWFQPPASQRVNNGKDLTFFAFHIDPYGVTSEDFHLYATRAKRILDRGWTDSPFNRQFETGHSYFAPLQVLLGMIAVQTDGRPLPYSIYVACILLLGWGTLFVVAWNFLPERIPTSTIILGVMVAVLLESLENVFVEPDYSFGIWPVERNLRLASLAWTTPWLIAAVIAGVSLWLRPETRRKALLFLGAALVALGATDNWAFGIAWMATGLVLLFSVAMALRTRRDAARWVLVAAVLALFLVSFGFQRLWMGAMQGDVLSRSGIGSDWLRPDNRVDTWSGLWREWLMPWGLASLAIVLAAAAIVCVRAKRVPSAFYRWNVRVLPDTAGRDWCAAIALLGVLASIGLNGLLSLRGMEGYLRYQIYWRIDSLLLLALTISLAACLPGAKRLFPAQWTKPIIWMLVVAPLIVLFAYHQYRIHWFTKHTIAQDYYLTSDAERLRDWLKSYELQRSEPYTLATLSHELNFLCAYWTHADLLLPSGFPYHSLCANRSIRQQAIQLLSLYRASQSRWREFNAPVKYPRRLMEEWRYSRVRAAGAGFAYHLYHRSAQLDRHSPRSWRRVELQAIGGVLKKSERGSTLQPDIILIDEVSRALGNPKLLGYKRKFKSATIEAWVREDPQVATASKMNNRLPN
ncbi:MAG: hypothetical protein IT427_07475 [Pirellulales bacterium]|nr:hypothetical protein [Pirellulales bacterium]